MFPSALGLTFAVDGDAAGLLVTARWGRYLREKRGEGAEVEDAEDTGAAPAGRPHWVWQRYPFGWAPIMEDKKWQREVAALGLTIQTAPAAAVHHTHDYDLRALVRRCRSEGYGWHILGVRYSLGDAVRDMLKPGMVLTLFGGLARGRVRSLAEVLAALVPNSKIAVALSRTRLVMLNVPGLLPGKRVVPVGAVTVPFTMPLPPKVWPALR